MKYKEPTTTALVLHALIDEASDPAGGFLNYTMLMQRTGRSFNQVSAACFHLRKRHAIDLIIQAGEAWWYETTVQDDRSFKLEERTPESKPRKRMKKGEKR